MTDFKTHAFSKGFVEEHLNEFFVYAEKSFKCIIIIEEESRFVQRCKARRQYRRPAIHFWYPSAVVLTVDGYDLGNSIISQLDRSISQVTKLK